MAKDSERDFFALLENPTFWQKSGTTSGPPTLLDAAISMEAACPVDSIPKNGDFPAASLEGADRLPPGASADGPWRAVGLEGKL
jgi:hypothetical protein